MFYATIPRRWYEVAGKWVTLKGLWSEKEEFWSKGQDGDFRGKSFKRDFLPFQTKVYFREKGLKRLIFFNKDSEKIYFPQRLIQTKLLRNYFPKCFVFNKIKELLFPFSIKVYRCFSKNKGFMKDYQNFSAYSSWGSLRVHSNVLILVSSLAIVLARLRGALRWRGVWRRLCELGSS